MNSFQDMALAEELHMALRSLKFTKPTEIQAKAIPVASDGSDLMACAETGSGKTAAYGIPMVSRLLEDPNKNGLILAPTRELAQQIAEFLRELTRHCDGLKVILLVGGTDIRKQFQGLKKRPRIIVATPGRLTDHLKRKTANLKSTEILVLDEGDRMLDMGFAPQLDEILKYVPKKRQTSLFSATLPEKVRKLAAQYLYQPKTINSGRASLPVSSIKQSIVQLKFKEKDNRIVDELNKRQGSVIVFARTKHRTDLLAKNLLDYGFAVDLIHGGRTQGQRNKAIRNFKSGTSRILCATDVAARGIDVPQVEHVINFDLPMMDEDYVHRIGRTARNGAKGEAVSFVTPEEHRTWMALARKYKITGVELEGVSHSKSQKKGRRFSKGKPSAEVSYRERRESFGKKKNRFSSDESEKSSFSKDRRGLKKSTKSFADDVNNSDRPGGSSFKKKKKKKFSRSGGPKSGGFKSGGFKKSGKKKSSSSRGARA